jgi:hypothetical protein
LLNDRLSVDPNSLPDTYRLWFSYPWYRIYTVNIDDLAEAAKSAFELPRQLNILSALSDPAPASEDTDLQVIHLNGTLGEFPNITFGERHYAQRLISPDLWYDNLVRDMQLHPILFVGAELHEPSLWTFIEARGSKPAREFRPGSYLVTPTLPRARRMALSQYNITWAETRADEFADEILQPLATEAEMGHAAISKRLDSDQQARILLPLLSIVDDSRGDEREFLLGREPRWSDITHGFAFERECDRRLSDVVGSGHLRLLSITGTAGTGKSTTAMRIVLDLAAHGKNACVLNPDSRAPLREIRGAVKAFSPDVLFIDNLERFGAGARDLLADVLLENKGLFVVACIQSSRIQGLGDLGPASMTTREFAVPHLGEEDIDELLAALDRANRLGALKGMNPAERRRTVRRTFGRQLLVAMIEITSNVRFDEKVESECKELSGPAAQAYAAAALATSLHTGLSDGELVLATQSENPSAATEAIDRLIGRHLLIRADSNRVALRHSVIAKHAISYYRKTGKLADAVTSLVYALTATARLDDLRATPSGRLLIRLLNHKYLIQHLYRRLDQDADRNAVRSVYEQAERFMKGDYHFWLQIGSFETKHGDLYKAKNFLDQAKSMEPDDLMVRTEWSYMTLKRAAAGYGGATAATDVELAFSELEDVIRIRGKRDVYPFHVYGSQGLSWARRGPLDPDTQKLLLERLRSVMKRGVELHPTHEELRGLRDSVEREYMMLAVPPAKKVA